MWYNMMVWSQDEEPRQSGHVLILGNVLPGMRFWSPWSCVCGAGGTGYNDEAATWQYEQHLVGRWPALIEPVGQFTEAHVVESHDGTMKTIWCKPAPGAE